MPMTVIIMLGECLNEFDTPEVAMRLRYIVIVGIILLIILGPFAFTLLVGSALQIAITIAVIYVLYKVVRRLRW